MFRDEYDAQLKKELGISDKPYYIFLAVVGVLALIGFIFAAQAVDRFNTNRWNDQAIHDLKNIAVAQDFTLHRVDHYGDSVRDINNISLELTQKDIKGINLLIDPGVETSVKTNKDRTAYVAAVMSKTGSVYTLSSDSNDIESYGSLEEYERDAESPLDDVLMPVFNL